MTNSPDRSFVSWIDSYSQKHHSDSDPPPIEELAEAISEPYMADARQEYCERIAEMFAHLKVPATRWDPYPWVGRVGRKATWIEGMPLLKRPDKASTYDSVDMSFSALNLLCLMDRINSALSTSYRAEPDGDQIAQALERVHEFWLEGRNYNKELKHPVGPLVKAWLDRPASVPPNLRPDPILPARIGIIDPSDSRAGHLFSQAVHTNRKVNQQLVMLDLVNDEVRGPALPLNLYDLGVGSIVERRSPAAPLALRLWIEAVLSVPLKHRDHPVSMSVSLRELLAWLYPGRQPKPNEYWPRLMRAARDLDSQTARIPWEDRATGRGGLRRVVSVSDIPRGKTALDDLVTLTVHLPPDSAKGPTIDRPRLRYWGTKSAPIYRAQIALAYRWHNPGRTHYPIRRSDGRGQIWLRNNDPSRYEPLEPDDLINLFFPTSEVKNRRILLLRAGQELDRMVKAGLVQAKETPHGMLLLPPSKKSQK